MASTVPLMGTDPAGPTGAVGVMLPVGSVWVLGPVLLLASVQTPALELGAGSGRP